MQEGAPAKKKRTFIVVPLCCAIAALIAVSFFYITSTPYYSLYMFKKAIVNRDAKSVLKYLDTDSILDNMAKDVFSRMDKKEPPRNKFEEHMQNAGKDLVSQLLPQLKKQMGEAITNLLLSYNDEALFGKLKRATIFGLSVTVEGNTALVSQRGKDTVSFTMAKAPEGHWRITSFNNDELKLLGK